MGLFKWLRSRDETKEERTESVDESHLPRLSLDDSLGNSDPEVRITAVHSISGIGAPAIPLLINCLNDESWRVRRTAGSGLAGIGEPSIEPMIAALDGARTDVRKELIRSLTLIGKPAIPALAAALDHPSEDIRAGAVGAIARINAPERGEALTKALSDSDQSVRAAAAEAFGHLPDEQGIPVLLRLLADPVERVRNAAILACIRIGKPAVGPLIVALGDPERGISPYAEEALIGIGSAGRTEVIELLHHENPVIRQSGVRILGGIRDMNTVSHLVGALADADPEVRNAAIAALSGFGKMALPEITAAFESSDLRIREGAMEILAGIGEPAIPSLIVYLKNEDPSVKKRAAVILGEIRSFEAHEPLTDLLHDSDPSVRREAFEAIEQIKRR